MAPCSIKWCGKESKTLNYKADGITFHRISEYFAEEGNMESLSKDNILEYNADTLVAVRKIYNLDKPGQMEEAIDLLDAWVKKQNHFVVKEFTRDYLERVIILLKGSVERAKLQLDKNCTLRTLLPHFFDTIDAKNELKEIHGYVNMMILPKLTKDHNRIIMLRFEPGKTFSSKPIPQIYKYKIVLGEYIKAHDYSGGLVAIVDFRDVQIMDNLGHVNLVELKQITTILLEGYDARVKKIIFISNSKAVEVIVKLCKQLMSEKLGQRIFVLKTVEELHEHVQKDLLPSDYGGDEYPLDKLNDDLLEVLSSEKNKNYLKMMNKCRTIESMRISSKTYEEFQDLAGTFRTLNVD